MVVLVIVGMAREEHSFSHCQYSFLSRMLQPFQRHHPPQNTLQVNALVEGNSKKINNKSDKVFSKSTVDLNCTTMTSGQMSLRQIGQYVSEAPSMVPHVGLVTRPRLSGAFVCCFASLPDIRFYTFDSFIIMQLCFSVKNGIEIKTVSASVGKKGVNFMKEISYTNEKMIGNGSFGVVYQATLIEENEVVAIKRVLQDRRFKNRELNIMVSLDHCNIVRLKYYFYTYKNVCALSVHSVASM